MVGLVGFQSHSYYLVIGFIIQGTIRERGDITERGRGRAETNPSNQPNQPGLIGGAMRKGAT